MINKTKTRDMILLKFKNLFGTTDDVDDKKLNSVIEDLYNLNEVAIKPLDEKTTYILRKRFGIYDNGEIQPISSIKSPNMLVCERINRVLDDAYNDIYHYRTLSFKYSDKMSTLDLHPEIQNIHTMCLDFDTRIKNTLMRGIYGKRIDNLRELLTYDTDSLMKIRSVGETTVKMIIDGIHKMGLLFVDELPDEEKIKMINSTPTKVVDNSNLYWIVGMNREKVKKLNNAGIYKIGDLRNDFRFNKNFDSDKMELKKLENKGKDILMLDEDMLCKSVFMLNLPPRLIQFIYTRGVKKIGDILYLNSKDIFFDVETYKKEYSHFFHDLGLFFSDETEELNDFLINTIKENDINDKERKKIIKLLITYRNLIAEKVELKRRIEKVEYNTKNTLYAIKKLKLNKQD